MNINTLSFNYVIDNSPIGTEKFFCGKTPLNWIAQHGQILKTYDYALLLKFAVENDLIVTESEWQNEKLYALFAYGETHDTFRIPDKRGLSPVGFEAGYHNKLGEFVQDQIVNIQGNAYFRWGCLIRGEGVFTEITRITHQTNTTTTNFSNEILKYDASRVVKTGQRVQARGFTGNWIIKYR